MMKQSSIDLLVLPLVELSPVARDAAFRQLEAGAAKCLGEFNPTWTAERCADAARRTFQPLRHRLDQVSGVGTA